MQRSYLSGLGANVIAKTVSNFAYTFASIEFYAQLRPFARTKMSTNSAPAATEKARYKLRLIYLALNIAVFAIAYTFSNAYAAARAPLLNVAMDWERAIPFLPWMIVPYMSSGIFFAGSFFWLRTQDQLRVFSQRLLLCTLVACLVFVLWPLRLTSTRPPTDATLWAPFFAYLNFFDRPYNQLPSLHVAYCVVFWSALKRQPEPPLKLALGIWLALVAMATLFTYQHHFFDVLAGLMLGGLSVMAVSPLAAGQGYRPSVALHYALAAMGSVFLGVVSGLWYVGMYFALCFALISWAYWRQNPAFLRKRRGRFPALSMLVFAPYLFGYWFIWCCVRLRDRGKPAIRNCTEKLLISRRLTYAESMQLPLECSVIDLANELTELKNLSAGRYHYFPMLDLMPIAPDTCAQIVALIEAEIAAGRSVLLHCAMGYARSVEIGDAYLDGLKVQSITAWGNAPGMETNDTKG